MKDSSRNAPTKRHSEKDKLRVDMQNEELDMSGGKTDKELNEQKEKDKQAKIKVNSNLPTESKIVVEAPPQPKVQENYFLVNSRCRISLKQYKKELALLTNPTNSQGNVTQLEYGLLELANENYTDFKNYFNSKTNRLFINITLGNEEIIELKKTLNGLLDNLNYLNKKIMLSQNDVSIIIIADGIANLHYEFKQLLFKSDKLMKDPNAPPKEEVKDYMHCFRLIFGDTTYISADGPFKKLDVMLAVKENNSGIINSHMCFFNGFCNDYNLKESADVCAMLTTTGTVLDHKAMMKCYSTMATYPELSAVTGQIEINTDNHSILSWVAGQYLDNKVNHIFERHLENLFGHINTLNSEFSFFKLKAITTEFAETYFKNSYFEDKFSNPFDKTIKDNSGKYLSGKLFLTQKTVNTFKLVPDAIVKINPASEFIPKPNTIETEKTTDFASYLHNRRHQYNSKLMGTIDFMSDFCSILKTQHTGIQKFGFCVLAIYHLLTQAMDYLMLSFNYIFIYVILSQCFFYKPETTSWLMWCYLILIGIFLILALSHNNVRHFETFYFILVCFLFTYYIFVVGCWGYTMFYLSKTVENIFNDVTNFNISPIMFTSSEPDSKFLQVYYRLDRPVIIGVFIINMLGYLIPLILSLSLNAIHVLRPLYYGIMSYVFTLPTFGGMQQIYSLSNCDDYNLHTFNFTKEEENTRTAEYRKFKVVNILVFIALNLAFIFIFAQTAPTIQQKISVVAGMVYFFTFFFLFKAFLSAADVLRFIVEKKLRHAATEKIVKSFQDKKGEANINSNIDLENVNINAKIEVKASIDKDKVDRVNSAAEVKTVSVLDKPKTKKEINLPGLNELTGGSASGRAGVGVKAKNEGNTGLNVNLMIDQNSFELLDRELQDKEHEVRYSTGNKHNDSLPEVGNERMTPVVKRNLAVDIKADIQFEAYESEGAGLTSKSQDQGNVKVNSNTINNNLESEEHAKTDENQEEGGYEDKNQSIENFQIEENDDEKLHNDSNWDSPKKAKTLDEVADKVKMGGKLNYSQDLKYAASVSVGSSLEVNKKDSNKSHNKSDIKKSAHFYDENKTSPGKKQSSRLIEEDEKKVTMGDVDEGERADHEYAESGDDAHKILKSMENKIKKQSKSDTDDLLN